MFEELNQKALVWYTKARTAAGRVKHRFCLACRRANTGSASEAGQGFVEYIIIIGGVLLIGAAIFIAFRVIRTKYIDASSAIQSLPIEGGW
jgi:hypothetical protein